MGKQAPMCVWCQYTNKAEGVFSLVRSGRKFLNMLPASHPFRNARGIFFILVRFVCASSVKLSDLIISFSMLVPFVFGLCLYDRRSGLSWGIEPGRDQVACTCSKFAQRMSRMGSLWRDVRLHHSCSTFDPGCSHLILLGHAE